LYAFEYLHTSFIWIAVTSNRKWEDQNTAGLRNSDGRQTNTVCSVTFMEVDFSADSKGITYNMFNSKCKLKCSANWKLAQCKGRIRQILRIEEI
jgi:hypothetical protein